MSRLSALIPTPPTAAPPERREFTPSVPTNFESGLSSAGEHVSERTAMRSVAVYACVKLLADNIATLPMDCLRKVDGIRQEVPRTPALVRRPNPSMTNVDFYSQVVTSLALRGNAYLIVQARDALEYPSSLLPVHPDDVQIEIDERTYAVTYRFGGEVIPAADMVHIPRLRAPGAALGISPIGEAAQSIGLDLAARKYGAKWFGESADPSSVLESADDLTQEQADRNMEAWIDSHGGKRHPAMLSGGLTYRRISITPEESQFLETRRFQTGEIARLFGVPPHMIGDTERSTSWGSGIEQQSIGFVRFNLRPWLTVIEQAISDLLPRGQFVRFNVEALLRGDTKARYDAYVSARNAGWLNVNEIRELEDRAPVEGGDEYLQPLNMGPLGSDPLADKGGDQGGSDGPQE
nr:phage portal protein [Isoptericola halotolerans]